MLAFFTIVIMLAVGYAFMVEGIFTACTMCINVFLAGLIAFNYFEPLAAWLEPMIIEWAPGYEDALSIVVIFALALFGLRTATNKLAAMEIEFPQIPQRVGGAVFGLITGYLVCGLLVCLFQTLPMHVNFMSFDATYEDGQTVRRVLPPDRVWLALMRRAGMNAFSNAAETVDEDGHPTYPTFDRNASYELRYARYRRYDDSRPPPGTFPYYGEFDSEGQAAAASLPAMPMMPGAPSPSGPSPAVPKTGNPPPK